MDILNIRTNIANFNNNIEVKHDTSIQDNIDNTTISINKHINENLGQYTMNQFLYKLSYNEYKKKLNKHYKPPSNIDDVVVYENTEQLTQELEKNQYKKKWSKLDNYSKKVKINEYITGLVANNTIQENQKMTIIRKLEQLVADKKLNKKNEIQYDEINGYITDIPIVKLLI